MVQKVVENKNLWNAFRQELLHRKVVTSLATKEVLLEFLSKRMKDFEEPSSLMGEHKNNYTTDTNVFEFKDIAAQKTGNESIVGNLSNKVICFEKNPFQNTRKQALPQLDSKHLTFGNALGKGSQSIVFEILSFTLKPTYSSSKITKAEESAVKNVSGRESTFMHHDSECNQQLPENFAAKLPRRDSKNYKEIVEELSHESDILSSVDHPNIIKIYGISTVEPSQPGSEPSSQPLFIILDRLSYDLDKLLKVWASKKNNINILKFQACKDESFRQRLKAARDIASAMKHLHKKKIMHRDLKPANIGFDSQGELKLFDFGYATKLQAKDRLPGGKYKLRGGIGTCRYMAPEVARYEPYDELADVYSFGVLLWEMLTLEKPYKNFDCEEWLQKVVIEGKRPEINKSWPDSLQTLLSCCWSGDIDERPSFDIIIDVLDEI